MRPAPTSGPITRRSANIHKMHYHAYGTVVQTNVAWPLLCAAPPCSDALSIQVERVTALPPSESAATSRSLQGRTVRFSGDFPDLVVRIDDLLSVSFDGRQRRINCLAASEANEPIIDYWLLRQIVPIARFAWGEAEILHAGAVRVEDEAIAFLAPSYTGKSTLVAHFIKQGHGLVSDDHLLIPRSEKQRPYEISTLSTLPFYRDYRTFESLGRHTSQFDPAPCNLRVIYVLKIADAEAPVSTSELSNADAAVELLRQAPYNLVKFGFPAAAPLVKQRFGFVANLAMKVAVRHLHVPRSLHRLPEVYAHIMTEFHRDFGSSQPLPQTPGLCSKHSVGR